MERALTTTREQLRHIFEVNVEGAFFIAQEAAKRMIAAGVGGSIINSSSILADAPVKGSAGYAMSKAPAGLNSLRFIVVGAHRENKDQQREDGGIAPQDRKISAPQGFDNTDSRRAQCRVE
eukprot:gene30333-37566_t